MKNKHSKHILTYREHLYSLVLLCFSSLLASCDSSNQTEIVDLDDQLTEQQLAQLKQDDQRERDHKVLRFGFDLRSSPKEDSRQYLPFLRYLESATGYEFELHFTGKGRSIVEDLGVGKVQFAAVGAVSYVHGEIKYGVNNLVRGLNHEKKALYQSMIVVHPDSTVKSITELRNQRFAFGSIDSTQGHLIPRIVLGEHGISLDDLSSHEYTGSHLNCANAVVSNKADACGMQDTMAKSMQKQGLVRILHESSYYPSSGIAVNADVPAEVIARVKQALLDFDPAGKHKMDLYNWHKTEMPNGFANADDEDYNNLRKWLLKLDLISLFDFSIGLTGKASS